MKRSYCPQHRLRRRGPLTFVEGGRSPAGDGALWQAALAKLTAYGDSGSAYARIQGTRPQTIGYSLADSPVGQAAWIYEKLAQWSDPNDGPEYELARDEMLDNIMLYWLSNSGASSARLYFESFATDFSRQQLDIPVVAPTQTAQPKAHRGGVPP